MHCMQHEMSDVPAQVLVYVDHSGNKLGHVCLRISMFWRAEKQMEWYTGCQC